MGRFLETFEQLGADGSEILAIMMSDVLSGTYQTACSAAEMVKCSVTVINSKETDRALSFQVLAAAKDAKEGKSIEEIKAHCLDIHKRTTTDVLVDNMDCLVAGGRVSKLAGALTKLINLKIIVRLRENSLDVVYKGRSRKAFLKYCQELSKFHQDNHIQELSLSNVGTDEDDYRRKSGKRQHLPLHPHRQRQCADAGRKQGCPIYCAFDKSNHHDAYRFECCWRNHVDRKRRT